MIRIHFPGGDQDGPLHDIGRILLRRPGPAKDDPWSRRYAEIYEKAADYFVATSAEEAQLFFYPFGYEPGAATETAGAEARRRGLPCAYFSTGDDPAPPAMPSYGLLFRHSMFSDQRRPREYAWPAIADDCLRPTGGKLVERRKGKLPRVGFRGFVGSRAQRLLYRLTGRSRKVKGLALRARALRNLQRSPKVETAFTPLNHFSMGLKGVCHQDREVAERVWRQYLDSLLDADYTLCMRGAGNFSYRFYETLSAGRIPVFLNTRCVLPFEEQIAWKKHCVWIEKDEIDQIADRVADFHERLSDADFVALQHANRKLWQDWLTPLGFYRQLVPILLEQKNK